LGRGPGTHRGGGEGDLGRPQEPRAGGPGIALVSGARARRTAIVAATTARTTTAPASKAPRRRGERPRDDSAASAALLFRDVEGAPVSGDGWARLRMHSGEASAQSVLIGPLRIGAVVLAPFAAGMMASSASERPEDGLLPTALFEGIYFDNRSGAVVFNPRRSALSKTAE